MSNVLLIPPPPQRLVTDPASQHHPDHFVITNQGPQRTLKCCRLVLLDEEVADPGGAVSGNQGERKEPPLANQDKDNNRSQRDRRTNEVQQTRAWLAVLSQVVRPEFSE